MKMKSALIALSLIVSLPSFAQEKSKDKGSESTNQKATIDSKVSGSKKYPGFIEYYYDEKQDKVWLIIDKIDQELLYVQSLATGIGSNDIGLDRGQLGSERVVSFQRAGSKILMVEPNLRYRAVSNNADERKAVEEAFAKSVLWGFKIELEEGNRFLVDATDFFLQDAHGIIETLKQTQQGTYSLDKSRSAIYSTALKNFPKNSEFEAIITYTGQPTGQYLRGVTPTPTTITVRQHHSFVELPDNNYKPRRFDPRAGYFSLSYYDYATPISEPIEKRFITRHRLEKKDPNAASSEAVEPIIYYLDRGTPEPIRSALLDGARWWSQAFEAAGFKNAYRVEMMPEGADPMDVRYNVIQWIHRSTRGWSYGSSVTDPRTGEIIKGHVSLGSLRVRQDYMIAEGLLAPYESGKPADPAMEKMALARLRQLSAHEVGHTLGLAHSYASSTEQLASVMDYPHPMVSLKDGKISLDNAYDDKIGEWDKVAIRYGYSQFTSDEDAQLNSIIQDALKKGLTFLSDQDARPEGSAHPFAHLWDNGKSAAEELDRAMEIRKIALKNFGVRNIREGMPMATLEEVLVPIYFFHRYQAEAAAKVVGGLNYRYALRGDGQPITELISPEEQEKALSALLKTLSPESLALPENLLTIIPPRPIGYSRSRELVKTRTDLAFDALSPAESAADMTLGLLLHPARVQRIIEHHARYPKQPSFESIIEKILMVTFKSDPRTPFDQAIRQTTSDVFLTNLLELAASKDASGLLKANAWAAIRRIQRMADQAPNVNSLEWANYLVYAAKRIKAFEEDPSDYVTEKTLPPPPGQPIGSAMSCDQFHD